MVLSRMEALLQTSEKEVSLIEAITKNLDQLLVDFDGTPISIQANVLGVNERIRMRVIEKYKGAGWDIVQHSDQRDGDFYTFA